MTASETQSTENNIKIAGPFELFSNSVSIYWRDFSLLFGYSAWLLIPVTISFLASLALSKELSSVVDVVINIVFYIFLAAWVTVSIMHLIPALKSGKKVSQKRLSSRAKRTIIPFLLVSALIALINVLGTIAFIIPGVIFGVWFSFANIFVVLEDVPIFKALQKSRELVRGKFFPILFRLLIGLLLFLIIYLSIISFGLTFLAAISGQDIETYRLAETGIREQVFSQMVDIFMLPLIITYHVLLYLEIKK